MRLPQRLAGKRPSGPMIMSTAALVVALGGTSYAAATIGTSDIKNGAVTSPKIKDGTIKQIDLAPGGIAGPQGPRPASPAHGACRPEGPVGPAGPAGDDGADGADRSCRSRRRRSRWACRSAGPTGTDRWLLVDERAIIAQSGGLPDPRRLRHRHRPRRRRRPAAPRQRLHQRQRGRCPNNGIVASVALQNPYDQDGGPATPDNGTVAGPDANPEFSGEITVNRCGIDQHRGVRSRPTGANTRRTRQLRGQPAATATAAFTVRAPTPRRHGRRRQHAQAFYVIITGDSSDYVAPTPAIPALTAALTHQLTNGERRPPVGGGRRPSASAGVRRRNAGPRSRRWALR